MAKTSKIKVVTRKIENTLYALGHFNLKLFRLKIALNNSGTRYM